MCEPQYAAGLGWVFYTCGIFMFYFVQTVLIIQV